MVTRTRNVLSVQKAVAQYADRIVGFDPVVWLSDPSNIALTNRQGDIALFEDQSKMPGAVCGHYFFFSRGRDAIKTSKEMLKEIFKHGYGVDRIIGLTPVDNLGALWMNKRLGFKEYGEIGTEAGLCKFVILTKNEWESTQNE